MSKIFRGIFIGIAIIVATTAFIPANAQVEVPQTSELFNKDNNEANLANMSDIRDYTDGSTEEGEIQFRSSVEKLLSFFKKLMIPIAILLLIYGGIELYLTHGDEEKYKKNISQLAGIATGFILMMVAVNLVDWVFFGKSGEVFREGTNPIEFAQKGMMEVVGIFDYLTVFAVILAVAFIVWNAITLILAGGEDEAQISAIKKRVIFSVVGIIILVSAKPMIQIITDYDGGLTMPDIRGGVRIIARWVNFVLGLIGIFAVISVIYAGIRLVLHFGDEEATTQAKKIMIAAVIGLVISFSAWTIIYYFIAPA